MRKMFWSIAIGVLAPLLASAANISIPPQPLGPSLQELAKQSGIQIIFFSSLVAGRDAPALKGTFTPEDALAALLDGTDLTYHVLNDRTIEVAERPLAAAASLVKPAPEAPLDEVVIEAQRENEKMSEMHAELDSLEDQFYVAYNKLNTDHRYDVVCRTLAVTGSHVERRVCQPAFVAKEAGILWWRFPADASAPLTSQLSQQMMPDYQKNMIDVVGNHPELLALLKKRSEIVERYEALRRRKLGEELCAAAIGLDASAGARAPASNDQPAQTTASISATLSRRAIHINSDCTDCDSFRREVGLILARLGARDVVVSNTQATFSALVPAGGGNQGTVKSQNVAARWEKVTLSVGREFGALGQEISTRILPLFTTCNAREDSARRLSVEVLRPVPTDSAGTPPSGG